MINYVSRVLALKQRKSRNQVVQLLVQRTKRAPDFTRPETILIDATDSRKPKGLKQLLPLAVRSTHNNHCRT